MTLAACWLCLCWLLRLLRLPSVVVRVESFGALDRVAARFAGGGRLEGISWIPFVDVVLASTGQRVIDHERCHHWQKLELGVLAFYPVYGLLWLLYGYDRSPMERAAYSRDERPLSWLRYLRGPHDA